MDTRNELTHLDLFSGVGGFAIAARDSGFRTLAFCEKDARCRRFLEKTWGIPVHPDITDLDASRYHAVSLLTGGPPCQPASRAGDQGGSSDDRWLWPQALRVLAQAEPDAVVFENPPGILDVGIDGILSEMGRLGYEVQCFDIPACAVDSPQLRHRIWIVGFRVRQRPETTPKRNGQSVQSGQQTSFRPDLERSTLDLANPEVRGLGTDRSPSRETRHPDQRDEGSVADPAKPRLQGTDTECRQNGRHAQCAQSVVANPECERHSGPRGRAPDHDFNGDSPWANSLWIPCADQKLRRAPDDSFGLVDGLHRSLLGALGNAVVPALAAQILNAVRQSL